MNFDDTPEEASFRAEVREFLEAHAEPRRGDDRDWSRNGASTDPWVAEDYRQRCRQWQRTLAQNGWAGIAWPKAFGGRGGTPAQQIIFNQELTKFDATSGFLTAALALVGPTLMAHGSREQQQRYLSPLLSGDEAWCQLFSEPEAGSDLASLATKATLDDSDPDHPEWVVNGQKVWNSSAQHADFGILICRTDPSVPKHDGITYFIVDMASPGIEVRPLVQAQGVAHFNEVFFSGVRIPAANVVGEVNGGWKVTKTTMRSESSMISGAGQASTYVDVLATARRHDRHLDPVMRQELAKVWSNQQILRYLSILLL